MIAATLVGWSLQQFLGWNDAFAYGLLAGLVLALLVPAKGACALPRRPVRSDGANGR